MASHKSAIKQNRKDLKRRERNRTHRSALRSAVKKVRVALQSGKPAEAESLLKQAISSLDRKASKGVIHRNAAARTKSRLTRQVRKLPAGTAAS
ncbi:MAG: 30S ribosomal protein S20 [Acidobacteria bacterium]|nr:MAG: 30S ribosomal protein S20 [Acidobacteriota bacterium]